MKVGRERVQIRALAREIGVRPRRCGGPHVEQPEVELSCQSAEM
jgi:hypothetical protein